MSGPRSVRSRCELPLLCVAILWAIVGRTVHSLLRERVANRAAPLQQNKGQGRVALYRLNLARIAGGWRAGLGDGPCDRGRVPGRKDRSKAKSGWYWPARYTRVLALRGVLLLVCCDRRGVFRWITSSASSSSKGSTVIGLRRGFAARVSCRRS